MSVNKKKNENWLSLSQNILSCSNFTKFHWSDVWRNNFVNNERIIFVWYAAEHKDRVRVCVVRYLFLLFLFTLIFEWEIMKSTKKDVSFSDWTCALWNVIDTYLKVYDQFSAIVSFSAALAQFPAKQSYYKLDCIWKVAQHFTLSFIRILDEHTLGYKIK